MKVLFAVSNENISESIIKKYQQEYKEIISSKNVYYFNAIIKELQKDKSYDRIIISEDLEPFANNNYEVIDKFIFEKLDNISDEATKNDGSDIPIILICADRRVKSENLLVKLFGIGVYSALLGQDRSINNVCALLNKPRSKKDAKIYYRIESDDVEYGQEGQGDVSEVEIQNILNHYKRLGKNEEKYVVSFDSIAAQYTDAQLRVICKFLPLNVRAVLEANSQKYQELITFGTVTPSNSVREKNPVPASNTNYNNYEQNVRKKSEKTTRVNTKVDTQLDVIERNVGRSNLSKPVVIPSSINVSQVKRANIQEEVQEIPHKQEQVSVIRQENLRRQEDYTVKRQMPIVEEKTFMAEEPIEEPVKRKRGRPRKVQPVEEVQNVLEENSQVQVISEKKELLTEPVKRKRGRPRKVQTVVNEEPDILPGFEDVNQINDEVNLFDLGEESEDINEVNLFDLDEEETNEPDLFDLGNEEEQEEVEETTGGIILPGFDDEEQENINYEAPKLQTQDRTYTPPSYENYRNQEKRQDLERSQNFGQMNAELSGLLSRDKKIVGFVGTSKNGTSFLINNLADMLSRKGINTAILDLTKNKNSYFIYTQNEEELRKKAYNCINGLRNGVADGIQVNKNLTVYTTVPEENPDLKDYQNILATLAKNYSLVLMDCDFETDYGYFDVAQEIYLVQSFDILTIQPLTAFLRDLKAKNILRPERLRIVLNKALRVRSLTERTIIGGMAFYNDPAMSFMTELFDKESVKYCVIPFEEETYSKYLEGLVNCQITTTGYSKSFLMNLDKLGEMVYPLISSNSSRGRLNTYNNSNTGFSNNMNATLNRMKNSY